MVDETEPYWRKYYRRNKKKILERSKIWRKKNNWERSPKRRQYKSKRYEENIEYFKKYSHEWYIKNRDKTLKRQTLRRVSTYSSLLNLLGGICALKNGDCHGPLAIHHIYGGGREDRGRFNRDRIRYMKYYLEHPDLARQILQVLCSSHHRVADLHRGIRTNKGVPKSDECKNKLRIAALNRKTPERDPITGRFVGS